MDWRKIREGISAKHLARDDERNIQMDLMKISPNWNDVTHWHDDIEWVYILEGSLEDERGKHTAGEFVLNDKDAEHKPWTKEGCLLLIVWCGSVRREK
jgi:anti-sigma factor ChrR (cupin superfamily)